METGHRTATRADYASIVQLLIDGDQRLLVRSLFRSDQAPYPLLNLCQGPFFVTEDGIEGLSMNGELYTLRITNANLCNVELRGNDGEWFAPEMGGIIILIPQ